MDALNLSVLLSIIAGITVMTFASGGAYAQMNGIALTWYLVVGAIVVGFMAAYAAMFGFDKLQEVLKGLQKKAE